MQYLFPFKKKNAYAHIAIFVTEKHNTTSLVKIISNFNCERLKLKGFQMEYPKT